MEKPIEPKLFDFGLTEDDIKNFQKLGHKSRFIAAFFAVFLGSYWVYGVYEGSHIGVAIFLGIAFLFPCSAFLGAVVYAIAYQVEESIYKKSNEKYRLYCDFLQKKTAYTKDTKAYDLWVARRQEAFWRSLSGIQFEVELGKLFTTMGFDVQHTPRTGDGGVDLLVKKGGHLTVVQCKAHQKKIAIGTIRELSASMRDFKAQSAVIACFEGVTKPVEEYIKDKPISVMSIHQIVALQRKHS